jgi:hypothetical protein
MTLYTLRLYSIPEFDFRVYFRYLTLPKSEKPRLPLIDGWMSSKRKRNMFGISRVEEKLATTDPLPR